MAMKISSIDHTVLTVKDVDETVMFYESEMGMVKEYFVEGGVSLKIVSEKIQSR